MEQSEADKLSDWLIEHKEQILADNAAGISSAKNIITLYRMLVSHADNPTWALLEGAIDTYAQEKGFKR